MSCSWRGVLLVVLVLQMVSILNGFSVYSQELFTSSSISDQIKKLPQLVCLNYDKIWVKSWCKDVILSHLLYLTGSTLPHLQLTTIERQVFDFLGYMWTVIIINFIHASFIIIGLFGVYQFRAPYIITVSPTGKFVCEGG